jgi:cytochrome P450
MSNQSALAPATLDFDHHSVRVSNHRDAVIAEVRDHPIFWTEANGGHWVVTSYELARRVLRDAAVFSSARTDDGGGGVTIPSVMGPVLIPAEADAPYHRALRKALTPKFLKKAIDAVQPNVEAIIRRAVDEAVRKGQFDIVHDIADVVPAGVMVEYLGFPDDAREPFIKAVQAALSVMPHAHRPEVVDSPAFAEGLAQFGEAVAIIEQLIADRRADPKDDLLSHLAAPEYGLDDEELLWLSFTLVVGGAENPAAMISNSLIYLYQDQALRLRLIAEPDLIPAATEELLRRTTAGVSLARNILSDIELDGAQLKAGQRILIWLPGANHDPAMFDDPMTIDFDRPACPHMAFGDGAHVCIGSGLFRMEFQILLKEILTRMPDYTIDLERAERFEDAATMWGFRTLPANTNLSNGSIGAG